MKKKSKNRRKRLATALTLSSTANTSSPISTSCCDSPVVPSYPVYSRNTLPSVGDDRHLLALRIVLTLLLFTHCFFVPEQGDRGCPESLERYESVRLVHSCLGYNGKGSQSVSPSLVGSVEFGEVFVFAGRMYASDARESCIYEASRSHRNRYAYNLLQREERKLCSSFIR